MGETVDQGVVAPEGRLFDPSQGPRSVYEGLYVCAGRRCLPAGTLRTALVLAVFATVENQTVAILVSPLGRTFGSCRARHHGFPPSEPT